ncbi:protein prenyltransferase alpha subunit repeat-containing protein 1 [Euwallacea fornicatus]|uniref:protein prenyltransferase alpha subunit repeat-containing protein 1 n=1 Tax=Euwallacea fornicatus TaxID=995702 RepID=UPI00338F943B
MEYASLSEKILRSIQKIIKNDPEIEDFGIVPTDDNSRNKSPVLYENHHLGLESWCIKYVYDYVCAKLMQVRGNLTENKVVSSIKEDLNYLLIGALLINPDVTTFWNMKRELVKGDVLNCEGELSFSKLVLTKKPKSNEAFSYRRWLITLSINKYRTGLGFLSLHSLLDSELALCTQTASSSPNNYHSWTHREWIFSLFLPHFPSIVITELEFSEQWINGHVSEHSGYHYRQVVIHSYRHHKNLRMPVDCFYRVSTKLNLSDQWGNFEELLVFLLGPSAKIKEYNYYVSYILLLLYELQDVICYIDKEYIEHESLWLHRRSIIYKLLEICHDYLGEQMNPNRNLSEFKSISSELGISNNVIMSISNDTNYKGTQAKIFKSQPTKFESTSLCQILYDSERDFIKRNSLRSALQSEYAKRYEKWLKYVVGFNIELYFID